MVSNDIQILYWAKSALEKEAKFREHMSSALKRIGGSESPKKFSKEEMGDSILWHFYSSLKGVQELSKEIKTAEAQGIDTSKKYADWKNQFHTHQKATIEAHKQIEPALNDLAQAQDLLYKFFIDLRVFVWKLNQAQATPSNKSIKTI